MHSPKLGCDHELHEHTNAGWKAEEYSISPLLSRSADSVFHHTHTLLNGASRNPERTAKIEVHLEARTETAQGSNYNGKRRDADETGAVILTHQHHQRVNINFTIRNTIIIIKNWSRSESVRDFHIATHH